MTVVTLYTRPGCCLCDEALEVLERVRGRVPFELHEVDITTDDALHKRYLELIPVVWVDDRRVFELEVDEAVLESALRLSSPPG
jgi:glutaredoxin